MAINVVEFWKSVKKKSWTEYMNWIQILSFLLDIHLHVCQAVFFKQDWCWTKGTRLMQWCYMLDSHLMLITYTATKWIHSSTIHTSIFYRACQKAWHTMCICVNFIDWGCLKKKTVKKVLTRIILFLAPS